MVRGNTNTLRSVALLAATAVSVPLVLGFLGRLHSAFDSFAHFRPHLSVILVLCGMLLLGLRLWTNALMAILLGLGAVYASVGSAGFSLMKQSVAQAAPADQPVYKLLQVNLRYDNEQTKQVLSLIAHERPDIVTLQEVSDHWLRELDLIKVAYPHRLDCKVNFFGTLILSRRPLDTGRNPYCSFDGRIAIAQVNLHGRTIDVAALHLYWPWPFEQADQIAAHAELFQLLGKTAIAAGDFNATPWSAAVAKVAELGGFNRIERVGATWAHRFTPRFMRQAGLPIDLILSKGDIEIHGARTLEPVGSDHLPVLVEFSLKPEVQTPPAATVSLTDNQARKSAL